VYLIIPGWNPTTALLQFHRHSKSNASKNVWNTRL